MKGSEWSLVEFLATSLNTLFVVLYNTSKNMTQDGNQEGHGHMSMIIKYVHNIHTKTHNNEGVECRKVVAEV
jgi:hypothetical protein